MAQEHMVDFLVADHGSIVLLHPLTAGAHEWVAEHLPEDVQRHGKSIAIERRYWGDIFEGLTGDGLTVA